MTGNGVFERPRAGLQPAIIGTAIRFRRIVVALSFLLLAYGALSLTQAKYDVFPEFAPPQVGIQTEAPGLAAEEIEVLVTQPLENAISGVSGIQMLRSSSSQGLSVVNVTFDPGSDIYLDRQVVAERLVYATQQLPAGVKPPVLTPLTSSSSTVLVAGLTSKTRSLMDLRTVADWTVRLRLLAVPGVSKVAVFGGEVRSIQVQVHPDAAGPVWGRARRRRRGLAQGYRRPRRGLSRYAKPAHRLSQRGTGGDAGGGRPHRGDDQRRRERRPVGRCDNRRCPRAADRRGDDHGPARRGLRHLGAVREQTRRKSPNAWRRRWRR